MQLTLNKSRKPKEFERSPQLRLLALVAMLTPLLALVRVVPDLWPHALVSALGLGLGHWFSYRTLDKNSCLVRGFMFILIHVAFAWLLIGLARGAVVPQAQFAIFTQAITSFDLRYRRSIFNSLVHSLANLYVAASLSRTLELALYLALFAGLVLAVLYVAGREDGVKVARLRPQTIPLLRLPLHRRAMMGFGLGFGVVALLVIFGVFLLTPRFANNPIVPPFTINVPLRGGVQSQIINPGVPLVQINGWSDATSDYFYGFDTDLDLRYRGGLSNDVVMYVRSPSRSYWRSHSYDFYTGYSWQQSDKTLTNLKPSVGVHYVLSSPLGASSGRPPLESEQSVVQSFTIVREQPNLVFAAYRPTEIFITADELALDSGDGLRLPQPLKPGFTYSVISYRPNFDPDKLRRSSTNYPAYLAWRYRQLPGNISLRVKNLAGNLTAGYNNNFDKVLALTNHLLTSYRYNLYPPPHPEGAEVVDTFLFKDKEGICEQFATALVVMARSLDIPARLAVGYGPGDYNPVTNYYEIRRNNAHSWVEVYFPEYGWVPFDPTPGWTPQPYPTPVQNWAFSNSSQFLGIDLPTIPLDMVTPNINIQGVVVFVGMLVGATLLVGLMMLLMYLFRHLHRSQTSTLSDYPYTSMPPDARRRQILQLYRQGAKLLTNRKYNARQQWEALTEYAHQVGALSALLQLTHAAEQAAYRTAAPEAETVSEARSALDELKKELISK